LGKDGDTLLAHLRTLQEELGNLNDAHVEYLRLQQWAEELNDNSLRDAIHPRLAGLNESIHTLTQGMPALLNRVIDPANRQTLGNALARF
jgi:CHAD domain-containing protein